MKQCTGIDVHRKFIQVCVMDQQGNVHDEARLDLDWPQELAEFFTALPPGEPAAPSGYALCGN